MASEMEDLAQIFRVFIPGKDEIGNVTWPTERLVGFPKLRDDLDPPTMKEFTHTVDGCLSHYLQGFIHPRWLFGISSKSINSGIGKKGPVTILAGYRRATWKLQMDNLLEEEIFLETYHFQVPAVRRPVFGLSITSSR